MTEQLGLTEERSSPWPLAARVAAYLAAYVVLTQLSESLSVPSSEYTTVWLPPGLVLATLLLSPASAWPWFAAVTVVADVVVELRYHGPVLSAFYGMATFLEALVAVAVVRRIAGPRPRAASWREVAALVVAAGLSAAAGAAVATASFTWLPLLSRPHDPLAIFRVWSSGDGLGLLVVTPAVLAWAGLPRLVAGRRTWLRTAEGIGLAGFVMATAFLVFGAAGQLHLERSYLVLLALCWGALRFGVRGASATSLAVTLLASWSTSRGYQTFLPGGLEQADLEIQLLLGVSACVALLLGASRDDRLRFREALRSERDFSRAVLEASATGMAVVDASGRFLYANQRLSGVLEIPHGELGAGDGSVRWGLLDLHGAPVAEDELEFRRVLATGEPIYGSERLVRTPSGTKPLSISAIPFRNVRGGKEAVVVSIQDLSRHRALEDQLAQAQKLEVVGRLAGGVAHDFNNLLTVILSNAQLAEFELPDDSPAREFIVPVREAAQRAIAVTRQLLGFTRRHAIQPRPVDANALVTNLHRLLQRLIGETIDARCRLAADLWPVHVDPGQLEQVLVNLAVNARDAMPAGGYLVISTENTTLDPDLAAARALPAGDYVHIATVDCGVGMDVETQRRAFEPFFTTKGERGTGLGLSISLGLVQQAGGNMWVESTPGRGAAFHVFLPRWTHSPAPHRDAAQPAPRPPVREATVLVVEDDEAVRAAAVRSLERAGYAVIAAASGSAALEVAARHPGRIDLLVSDMVMPGMNGADLAETLRTARPSLRVLLVSGYAGDAALRAAAADGSASVLLKPFTPDQLVGRVAETLGAGGSP
ncbi:MAG TPA: MASE1 domain-containing protein [Anaeromyxobacteraceae bacterium]|nr:MASE1 domain-containing protein [Anaeromyxobacteraceae bacterium]